MGISPFLRRAEISELAPDTVQSSCDEGSKFPALQRFVMYGRDMSLPWRPLVAMLRVSIQPWHRGSQSQSAMQVSKAVK